MGHPALPPQRPAQLLAPAQPGASGDKRQRYLQRWPSPPRCPGAVPAGPSPAPGCRPRLPKAGDAPRPPTPAPGAPRRQCPLPEPGRRGRLTQRDYPQQTPLETRVWLDVFWVPSTSPLQIPKSPLSLHRSPRFLPRSRAAVRCFAAKAHHFRTQRKSYFFFPLGSPILFLGKIII